MAVQFGLQIKGDYFIGELGQVNDLIDLAEKLYKD